jgi:hypothetical protein
MLMPTLPVIPSGRPAWPRGRPHPDGLVDTPEYKVTAVQISKAARAEDNVPDDCLIEAN